MIPNNPYYINPKTQTAVQGGTNLLNIGLNMLPGNQNPYEYDKTSSLRGLGQGAQIGSQFGPVGTAIGATAGFALGGIGEAINNRKTLRNINTGTSSLQTDAYGRPTYSGLGSQLGTLDQLNQAVANDKGKWNFNERLRKRKRNDLAANIDSYQNAYNTSALNYDQNQLARMQYEDQIRKNNIYNIPMNFI